MAEVPSMSKKKYLNNFILEIWASIYFVVYNKNILA
jgi:hypothetical protein